MDELLAYATSKGIGLIPAVSPGHMDAYLGSDGKTGYQTSWLDLWYGFQDSHGSDNEEAVNSQRPSLASTWTFKGKSKIFNYGTNEYANDATNAQGWYYLKWYELYGRIWTIPNSLAAMAHKKACNGL